MAMGDRDDPFMLAVGDRRQKWCKCSSCGEVAKCTPHFDFYTRRFQSTNGLECERCMRERLAGLGVNVSLMPPLRDS